MELMSRDEDIKKNFLDHNIKKLLKSEWDIDCSRPFKHVFRWKDGPRVNGVEPILVIFEERKEKELVWTKLRDNLKTKTNVVVTQDSSTRRLEGRQMERQQSVPRKISTKSQSSPRKTAVVKPSTHSPDRRLTPEVPQTPQPPPE